MALLAALLSWPVASQQKSRRNAMLACTSLTQRRMERQDVEDYLRRVHGSSSLPPKAVAHG